MFLSNFWFCEVSFSREHKPLFIPIGLCFMKKHVWRVSYFFIKRLTNIEISLCFMKRHMWRVGYFFIKRLTKIETSSIFLNSRQKIQISNFHLENFRTWIFTLWNHILQTQPSLLQPILVYTYIYNILNFRLCFFFLISKKKILKKGKALKYKGFTVVN